MLRALEAPIRQIVENAGVEGSIVVSKVLESKSDTYGFDAQTETYVDMVAAGIIDPTKVVRTALQDAASVAGLLVTTEAMVAERPKKERRCRMPGGGGGMGGDGLLGPARPTGIRKGAAKAAPFSFRRRPDRDDLPRLDASSSAGRRARRRSFAPRTGRSPPCRSSRFIAARSRRASRWMMVTAKSGSSRMSA